MLSLELLPWLPAYLGLGIVGGFAAGLLGIGGGMLYVPLLTWLFELQGFDRGTLLHLALGTSLTTIVFTSISSARTHHGKGNVDWSIVRGIAPGIVAGGVVGGWLAKHLGTSTLALVFAVFVTYSALQMFLNAKPKPSRALPGALGLMGVGTVISTLSQLVGAGGGFLSVPFMTWCNVNMHRAVGTSAAIGLPIAVVGTVAFFVSGRSALGLPPGSLGFIYLPALLGVLVPSVLMAPVGARLAARLPVATLKRVFAGFLFVLAAKMLHSALLT
ncbi:sulfite exporter TauE/SafE family protein [Macromonas nakdongensis]|uniref:sulfite exporter TauE/SafE family protein n=1 Tax=Macromonas nakdongensis TaxID=1843082 RepID=UPI000C340B16|nr:sulfite exporter TauE/SafE family protein [Macromonas nakdongensis]